MLKSSEKKPIKIGFDHYKYVCVGLGGDYVCRFLVCEEGEMRCSKHSLRHHQSQTNVGSSRFKGDNCSGPPDFKRL